MVPIRSLVEIYDINSSPRNQSEELTIILKSETVSVSVSSALALGFHTRIEICVEWQSRDFIQYQRLTVGITYFTVSVYV